MTDPNPTTPATEDQKKEALAAFTATLHSVGTNLEAPLIDRANTITSNAAALQRQENELAEHTARLAKQNAGWAGLADETRDGLKEIGDVQNWAEMIERDLLVLEDMMDQVEKKDSDLSHGRDDHDGDGDGDEGPGGGHGGLNGNGVWGNGPELNGGPGGEMNGGQDHSNTSSNGKKKKEARKSWLGWW